MGDRFAVGCGTGFACGMRDRFAVGCETGFASGMWDRFAVGPDLGFAWSCGTAVLERCSRLPF